MKVFDLRCWRWLAMIFVATVVVACSEDDYDYNPAPADKTIPDVRPDGVPLVHTKAVRELMKICSEHHEVKHLLEKAIAQAASINPDKKYNPAQTLEEFFTFVDWNIRALPWDVMTGIKADGASLYSRIDQGVGYFWFVVDQPLDELKDRGFFYPTVEFVEPFASWLTTYANAWGDWLNSPLSWNDSYYKMVAADPDFGIDKGWYEDGSNYPDDVNIKTAMFSDMADLIGHDSRYKDAFAGGTLTHTFLDVNDYHHYHSPVEGKLVELRTIPGVAAGGGYTLWDNEAKRYYYVNDMGFQMVETRACAIIETKDFGLVAMLPVGMSQICSVNWNDTLKEGQWLKKGDDMGSFLFGGSDVIMVFQKGVNVELLTTPDGEGGYEHILMGEPYAKLVVNR